MINGHDDIYADANLYIFLTQGMLLGQSKTYERNNQTTTLETETTSLGISVVHNMPHRMICFFSIFAQTRHSCDESCSSVVEGHGAHLEQ